MTKIENDIHEEMKEMIEDKTECMIESYSEVLGKTINMMSSHFIDVYELSSPEIAKRADMFWNIALQRIESDKKDVARELERKADIERRKLTMPDMPPMTNEPIDIGGRESPCAKKARESAEKIAKLEAEVLNK